MPKWPELVVKIRRKVPAAEGPLRVETRHSLASCPSSFDECCSSLADRCQKWGEARQGERAAARQSRSQAAPEYWLSMQRRAVGRSPAPGLSSVAVRPGAVSAQ